MSCVILCFVYLGPKRVCVKRSATTLKFVVIFNILWLLRSRGNAPRVCAAVKTCVLGAFNTFTHKCTVTHKICIDVLFYHVNLYFITVTYLILCVLLNWQVWTSCRNKTEHLQTKCPNYNKMFWMHPQIIS